MLSITLAKFMHDIYETEAKKAGWKTQRCIFEVVAPDNLSNEEEARYARRLLGQHSSVELDVD